MMLELENRFAVIDLRTKKDMLSFIKHYDSIRFPVIDSDGCTFYEDIYNYKEKTGMTDEQIVDMIFAIEDGEDKNIQNYYYTDSGALREFEANAGEVSYFRYEECDYEPDYPYITKLTKEEFDKEISEIYYFIEAYQQIEE